MQYNIKKVGLSALGASPLYPHRGLDLLTQEAPADLDEVVGGVVLCKVQCRG